MAVVLVTGNPGSGKSSLVAELVRRGVAAVDADTLAGWESTDERSHGRRWVWPRERVERLAAEHAGSTVFLCGIAMNQREMLDLFDVVLLLAVDEQTQLARLDAAGDRSAAERAEVVAGRPVFEAQMTAAGAHLLDGGRPTAQVADEVLHEAAAGLRLR